MGIAIVIGWFFLSYGIAMASTKGRHLANVDDHQAGFISIDCGTNAEYKDEETTIYYTPDALYINTGISKNISSLHNSTNLSQQLYNVRSFPDGTRNCYTLRQNKGKGTNYLVRAYFMYGNYDLLETPPTFDLHLGVDVWDTVKLDNSSQVVVKEMIHTPSTDYLHVCLVNTDSGTPFISSLEVRHLTDSIYTRESGSLDLLFRGHSSPEIQAIRYPDDIFDRIWTAMSLATHSFNSTKIDVDSAADDYKLPSSVMKVAVVSTRPSQPIIYLSISTTDLNTEFYIYFHVAELQNLSSSQIREFNFTINEKPFYGPYAPKYLIAETIYNRKPIVGSQLHVTLQSTTRATLPPILSAFEIFKAKKLSQLVTEQQEADALGNIKSFYNLTKNWQGDPCNPKAYAWDGVGCSYENSSFDKITSLDLSSSGLTGVIAAAIANLSMLQVLDLSNNKLSGQIPKFLTELPLLKTLNLTGNNFTGSIPELLLEKSKEGSLSLSTSNNPGLCSDTSCTLKIKKKKLFAPVAATVVVSVLLLAVFVSLLVYVRRRKPKAIESQSQTTIQESGYIKRNGGLSRFTYSEVNDMTKGLQRELGRGGYGVVYHGCLQNGTEVAVKILSPSINASEQFSTEVELLMDIRHKNLVSLIGYCKDGTNLALVYEYMASGNLETFLLDATLNSLSWKRRLQIAIDAAQGLDYLHNGCRPPIIHRDVKTPNILLNQNLQAKIADFGYFKIFPDEYKSHVSTRVIGTAGYLDPEYYVTQQLNEKSDVYSFGVVLLELITGQVAMEKKRERTTLVQWIMPMIQSGDIWNIVDQKLKQIQDSNSVWRAIDMAIMCVKPTAVERPTMSQIVAELKECLAMEINDDNARREADNSIEMRPMIPTSAMTPDVR